MRVRATIKTFPEKEIIIFQCLDDDLRLSEESVKKIYCLVNKIVECLGSQPVLVLTVVCKLLI